MSPGVNEIETARRLVAKALSVSVESIGPDCKMYNPSIWDSLGQLSVILAIEQESHAQVTDPAIFDSLTSVAGIAGYLATHPG